MSIMARMQPCKLYEYKKTGINKGTREPIYGYVLIQDIYVDIEFYDNQNKNDIEEYKLCQYRGLTNYKGLNESHDYRLTDLHGINYKIKKINNYSRMTQFLLERVASNEQ